MQSSMFLIWIGALLVVGGVVFMAAQAIWKGRMSDARRTGPRGAGVTLEPRAPAKGFGIKANWPGLALVAVGSMLMLVEAAF